MEEGYDLPGLGGETFKIKLDAPFNQGDTVDISNDFVQLEVTGLVKHYNNKWYHKIVNKLTFGKFCNEYFVHEVKIAGNE